MSYRIEIPDTPEWPTGAEFAAQMAKLTRALHLVVSRMVAAYEAAEGADIDTCDFQPLAFAEIIPHSLDEWAVEIPAVTEAWEALAAQGGGQ